MKLLERAFFEAMPKAEHHLHLDGALKPPDIWAIASEHGQALPHIAAQSREAVEGFFHAIDPDLREPAAFDRFLRKFNMSLAVMQTPKKLQKAAYLHVKDLARQNFVYAETRFAPTYHQKEKGLTLEDVTRNILTGLEAGFRETGTRVRLILCIPREMDPQEAVKIAQAALEFQDLGVIGIDLACNEILYPPELFVAAFQTTFGSKLLRTVHAGELAPSEAQRQKNIKTAIDQLGAQGLGHGVSLVKMPELMAHVARHRIRVESCPLSNRFTGAISDIGELGLADLLRENVRVTLNTDDPTMFGTSLADVYEQTVRAYDFDFGDVRQLVQNCALSAPRDDDRSWISGQFKRRGLTFAPRAL